MNCLCIYLSKYNFYGTDSHKTLLNLRFFFFEVDAFVYLTIYKFIIKYQI